ncbi:autotransporter outer membrane beta-barrel domain-containing protein [Martelella sp. AMO21009]
MRGGLGYTWHDVSSSRTVAFTGFADSLAADYDAAAFQAFGEAACRFDTGLAAFEPFVGLAYVRFHQDGFTETGGAAALSVDASDMDTTFATIGARAERDFALGDATATLSGTLGWQHAFGAITPLAAMAFAGSDSFSVAGTPIARNAAVVEAGLA